MAQNIWPALYKHVEEKIMGMASQLRDVTPSILGKSNLHGSFIMQSGASMQKEDATCTVENECIFKVGCFYIAIMYTYRLSTLFVRLSLFD